MEIKKTYITSKSGPARMFLLFFMCVMYEFDKASARFLRSISLSRRFFQDSSLWVTISEQCSNVSITAAVVVLKVMASPLKSTIDKSTEKKKKHNNNNCTYTLPYVMY